MGKAIIAAYQNGVRVGYVKSVSYKNGSFKLTQDKGVLLFLFEKASN